MRGETIAAVDREQWHAARRGRRLALYAALTICFRLPKRVTLGKMRGMRMFFDMDLTQYAG